MPSGSAVEKKIPGNPSIGSPYGSFRRIPSPGMAADGCDLGQASSLSVTPNVPGLAHPAHDHCLASHYCACYQNLPAQEEVKLGCSVSMSGVRESGLLTDLTSSLPKKASQQQYYGAACPGGKLPLSAVVSSPDALPLGKECLSSRQIKCFKAATHASSVGKFPSTSPARKPGTGVYMPGPHTHSLNQGKSTGLPLPLVKAKSTAVSSPVSSSYNPQLSRGGSAFCGANTPGGARQGLHLLPLPVASSARQPLATYVHQEIGALQCCAGTPHQEVLADYSRLSSRSPSRPILGTHSRQNLLSPKPTTQHWTSMDGRIGFFLPAQDDKAGDIGGCSWGLRAWSANSSSSAAGILGREKSWVGRTEAPSSSSCMVSEPCSGSKDLRLNMWPACIHGDVSANGLPASSTVSTPTRNGPAGPDPTMPLFELGAALWRQQQSEGATSDLGTMLYGSMEAAIKMQARNNKAGIAAPAGPGLWHGPSASSVKGGDTASAVTPSRPGQPPSPKSPLDEAMDAIMQNTLLQQQYQILSPTELTAAMLPSEDELGAGWS